jgi:hypothetical protein
VIEMKKIITSICLIVLVGLFVCSTANAGMEFCARATVKAITLYSSCGCGCDDKTSPAVAGFENNAGPTSFSYLGTSDVPTQSCKVALEFDFPNGETSLISATACGTQINLALLKAFNFKEDVYLCLYMTWDPAHGGVVTYDIKKATFPVGAQFPVNQIGDVAGIK